MKHAIKDCVELLSTWEYKDNILSYLELDGGKVKLIVNIDRYMISILSTLD